MWLEISADILKHGFACWATPFTDSQIHSFIFEGVLLAFPLILYILYIY